MPKKFGVEISEPFSNPPFWLSYAFKLQSLGDVTSNQVGWKHGALIQRLESQRKAPLLDLDLRRLLAQDE